MGDKPSKSRPPPVNETETPKSSPTQVNERAVGGMSREISIEVPIIVEDDLTTPTMQPRTSSGRVIPSEEELKKRQTMITKDIMLRNGDFGPAEATLLAKMFMEYFSKTDNYLQAYQRFHREIRVFSIHGDSKQKKMAQRLLEIHTDEVKRYGNIAYGNIGDSA